jgi:uncharacterized protein (DUF1697 family)
MTGVVRQVVLLRGVNIGARRLSMPDLRAALTDAGCRDVVTYIQSGNVVLTPPSRPRGGPQRWLEQVIADVAGYEVPVVLRTATELEKTVAHNPYPNVSGKQLHVVFFSRPPPKKLLTSLQLATFAPEQCALRGRDLYLNLPNGMGRAKLPVQLERAGRLLTPPSVGTARNWNTVLKLLDLARR